MKRLMYIMLVGLLFTACANDLKEEITTGRISGSVSDKTTGEPVATVIATLSPSGRSTVTGSDGAFEFIDLSSGEYTINISKEGYKGNDKKVTVVAGQTSQTHLLIERIPAVITADYSEIDFGETLTTLAFSIINSGYETLSWHIEYDDELWIKEIKPLTGELESGKTAAIVVNIDREKLRSGNNEMVLVVVSNNGKTEIKAKAIGEAKVSPALNINEASNITSNSAVLHAEITEAGVPAYTERGFIYDTLSNPTLWNNIAVLTSPLNEDKIFSYSLEGLALGNTYYVKAYAISKIDTAYSNNEIKIATVATAPVVVTNAVSGINVNAAIATLNATVENIGDPSYIEKGFVYAETPNPTIENTKIQVGGVGDGEYSMQINNLTRNMLYYVRAYIINTQGVYYSKNEISFKIETTPPAVSVKPISNLDVIKRTATLNGVVDDEGVPAYTERGFVYHIEGNPTIENTRIVTSGKGKGEFSANISNLNTDQPYYVRAYAINDGGITYSNTQETFTLSTSLASVSISQVSDMDIDDASVVLNATITDAGVPPYTERGFVYSTSGTPTINENKLVVEGTGTGTYSFKLKGLEYNKQYYVRAYVINEKGIAYSSTQETFTVGTTSPATSVLAVTDINYGKASAVFNGTMSNTGNPKYTERGFVYGTMTDPTIEHNKVVASSSGSSFNMKVAGLELNTSYYVRTYAIQNETPHYSSNEVSFVIEATLPEVTTPTVSNIDYANRQAIFTASVLTAGDPAFTEKGFVYGLSVNPNVYDDMKVSSSNPELGEYNKTVTELQPNVTYHLRAYAQNSGGVAYSEDVTFSLTYTEPNIGTLYIDEINLNEGVAVVRSSVIDGNPMHTERGFVYATHSNPTINDNYVIVEGTGTGDFVGTISNLDINKTYYVKAYVKTEIGVYYSSDKTFTTEGDMPGTPFFDGEIIEDRTTESVTVYGCLYNDTNPEAIELGFVYSNSNTLPSINDKVIVGKVTNNTSSRVYFSSTITNLNIKDYYYIRPYAKNRYGTMYGEVECVWGPLFIEIKNAGIAVQCRALGRNDVYSAKALCENSSIGGYTDWRLPTNSELATIYSIRSSLPMLEKTDNAFYWSSSGNVMDMENGSLFSSESYYKTFFVLPVRTLTE